MFFLVHFERHLLRGVHMLMQYLQTTATACCFSTLIHTPFKPFNAYNATSSVFSASSFNLQTDSKLRYPCTGHDTMFQSCICHVLTLTGGVFPSTYTCGATFQGVRTTKASVETRHS
jgi:hypothetical protein